jgi:hypothetical protein
MVTIPLRLKHLAHKVGVGVLQSIKLLPSRIIGGFALPTDAEFDERAIVAQTRTTVEHLHGFQPENSMGINWG